MDLIHADVPDVAATTSSWAASAPTQASVHPICTPGTDPMTMAVSGALTDWPAAHEALTAHRATKADNLVADNSGTETTISEAEAANVSLMNGIEV